jgi:hypothetical protein
VTSASHLSDRMPAVAQGQARWSSPDADHLARCAECRTEWELVSAASLLGRDLALDLDRIEAGVRAGLRQPAAPRRSWIAWLAPVAVAASLALVVWNGSLNRFSGTPQPAAQALLPELETLTTAELESMLTLLPGDAGMETGPDGFEDLSESEFSSVLKDLEG